MRSKKNNNRSFSTNELILGSDYFEYHIRMFVETNLELTKENFEISNWQTNHNSFLESHLIHTRVLIEFLLRNSANYQDDLLAIDYSDKWLDYLNTLSTEKVFLDRLSKKIGGTLVHITTKAMPSLKSKQEWSIQLNTSYLKPISSKFVEFVTPEKVYPEFKNDCFSHLEKLNYKKFKLSVQASI